MNIPAFAVIATYPMFCPSTNVLMGIGSHVVSRHLTIGEAEDKAERLNKHCLNWEYRAKMKRPCYGEDEIQTPECSMPELICDEWADHQEDAISPEHML